MTPQTRRSPTTALVLATLILVAAMGIQAVSAGKPQGASGDPADKGTAMATSFELLFTQMEEGANSTSHTLFESTLKNSGGTDLLLSVNLECSIWTDVTLIGNSASESSASVNVWIEIDGNPVTVGGDDTTNPGKVTFCNRVFGSSVTNLENESIQHEQYIRTKGAHSFEWIQLNLDSGYHTITVKADLEAKVDGTGLAKAGIGKRTFVVEPTKFANDLQL